MNQKTIPQFPVPYLNRCYCRNNCCCNSFPKNLTKSTHKFIKIINESGNLRPKAERISESGPSSRCSSKCTVRSSNESYSHSDELLSQNTKLESDCTSSLLTERRQIYEMIKKRIQDPEEYPFYSSCDSNFIENINDNRIRELNTFRLRNPSDCFSVLSKHSINQRLGRYDEAPLDHVCEYRYRVNDRELLEPADKNEDGRLVCAICKKTSEKTISSDGQATILTGPKNHKLILEIQESNRKQSSKDSKRKSINLPLPANSLALRYQKRN